MIRDMHVGVRVYVYVYALAFKNIQTFAGFQRDVFRLQNYEWIRVQ